MITLVTGATRCGSTLVMRMLHNGGLSCYADNTTSFETTHMLTLPDQTAWLDACEGQAVKILDPLTFTPPPGRAYRLILVHRDPDEQAQSMVTFLRTCGIAVDDSAIAPLALGIRREQPMLHALCHSLGPTLPLAFAAILADPAGAAAHIATFLGLPLHVEAMAATVLPRAPTCYPGMLEWHAIGDKTRSGRP